MFHLLDEFDRTFAGLDELRRQFDSAFYPTRRVARAISVWPRANLFDTGNALVISAEVPGVAEKDIDITLHDGTLTLSGKREVAAPEGYSVHRRERGPVEFSRSFALPSKVNAEKVSANLRDGLLTVELAKAADAQPRQITIKS